MIKIVLAVLVSMTFLGLFIWGVFTYVNAQLTKALEDVHEGRHH